MLRRLKRCICQRLRCQRHRWNPICFLCVTAVVSFTLSVASFAYAFRHVLFDTFLKCSDEESLDYINKICQLYKEGVITGSLCHPLCETGQVQYNKCADFHAGKRVSIMSCSDYCVPGESVPAVLKAPNKDIPTLFGNSTNSVAEIEVPEGITSSVFLNHTSEMILKTVQWELGFSPFSSDADIVKLMWEKDFAAVTSLEEKRVMYQTIKMLLDENEYLFGKALESSGVVPHIYGTCGPMYLQESCPPGLLDKLPTFEEKQQVSWSQIATTVIKLLQLIQKLEQHFPEVLHLCDVKGSNFGVCSDGSVKVIDADTIFFHTTMMDTFAKSTCKTHGDCNFFDCGGWCQTDTGMCHTVITNNNLQTVCRDVLSSAIPEVLGWDSMFSGAPASVKPKLKAILNECLKQTAEEKGHIPVYKPPQSLLTRLVRQLIKSLSEDNGDS